MNDPVAALITDFGMADGYPAAMKGVILGRCAQARIIDLTHAVNRGDVLHAAYVLRETSAFFPPHTVFVGVVDTGVGTSRALLAAQVNRRYFLAPDNGLLDGILRQAQRSQIRKIQWKPDGKTLSRTFHGRDWLAPAAAELLLDPAFFDSLGPRCRFQKRLPDKFWGFRRSLGGVRGSVIRVDHFGNLVSSIPASALRGLTRGRLRCQVGSASGGIRYRATYGRAGKPGELLWLINSGGWVEVAAREGSAADALGATRGDWVTLRENLYRKSG